MSEYDPAPPFNAGSMKTASAEVKDPMIKMLAGFKRDAEELARATEDLTSKPDYVARRSLTSCEAASDATMNQAAGCNSSKGKAAIIRRMS